MSVEIERRFFVKDLDAMRESKSQSVLCIEQGYIDPTRLEVMSDCLSIKVAPAVYLEIEVTDEDRAEISALGADIVLRARVVQAFDDMTNEKNTYLTIKGKRVGNSCPEFEYEIFEESQLLMLAAESIITKKRRCIVHDDVVFEVDAFAEPNNGLFIAEVELDSEDQPFSKPDWLGCEIPKELASSLSNYALSKEPISGWSNEKLTLLLKYNGFAQNVFTVKIEVSDNRWKSPTVAEIIDGLKKIAEYQPNLGVAVSQAGQLDRSDKG